MLCDARCLGHLRDEHHDGVHAQPKEELFDLDADRQVVDADGQLVGDGDAETGRL